MNPPVMLTGGFAFGLFFWENKKLLLHSGAVRGIMYNRNKRKGIYSHGATQILVGYGF